MCCDVSSWGKFNELQLSTTIRTLEGKFAVALCISHIEVPSDRKQTNELALPSLLLCVPVKCFISSFIYFAHYLYA